MRRVVLALSALASLTAATVSADDVPPPIPLPLPNAIAPAANAESGVQAIEHLLQAARHLEAAGLLEDAARLKQQARKLAIEDDVLSRKEAELECLQEEIDRLRELTGQKSAVIVTMVALEFDRSKLGNRAAELDRLLGLPERDSKGALLAQESEQDAAYVERPRLRTLVMAVRDANPMHHPLFKRLQTAGLVSILAEPTLMTTNRRPASFLQGGQIPISVRSADNSALVIFKPYGTQMEIVPTLLPNERIRLQARLELSALNRTRELDVNGQMVPEISSRVVNTEVELQSGQTIVLAGMPNEQSRGEVIGANSAETDKHTRGDPPKEIVVLLTAQSLDSSHTPHAGDIIPAAAWDPEDLPVPPFPQIDLRYFPATPVLPRGMRR